MTTAVADAPTVSPVRSPAAAPIWNLFWLSVLSLFVELLLIRWISTEIRIFAYLQNTVLVVCFLGLGMGCWTCRKEVALRDFLRPLFILTLLLAIPMTRTSLGKLSDLLNGFNDFVIWGPSAGGDPWHAGLSAAFGLVLFFFLSVLIWDLFVPLGRLLGRLLDDHPRPVWAYSVNVAGSLAGIWLFVLLSALYQPPFTWLAVTAALIVILHRLGLFVAGRVEWLMLAGLLILGVLAGWENNTLQATWSPYQKLTLRPADEAPSSLPDWLRKYVLGDRDVPAQGCGEYVLTVNNVGYQAMIDLSPEHVRDHPDRFPPDLAGVSQYDLPLLLHPNPRKFLAVGAGSGNDVAGGLRNPRVEEVVAVEIDPAILAMGRELHPERPYQSPRVRAVNDDARSYFATCAEKFDVIAFGLLDSHTTTAMTNARLDHYVYTVESLRRAKELLNDGGVMVLSFEAQKPFIADRMASALRQTFGQEPLCIRVPFTSYGWGGVVFVVGDLEAATKQIAANPRLSSAMAKWQSDNPVALTGTARLATDDWPYIYLQEPCIPVLYFLLAGLLLLLFGRGLWKLGTVETLRGWGRREWHFFFLGAAFMLLEVQNVSKAAVVLGNTWQVNAVIISGILAVILVANAIAARFPKLPLGPVYAGLILSCVGLYFIDLAQFGFLPYSVKAVVVGGLTSLPMLFSGIVFVRSFAGSTRKDLALGANLMGALVGALLQSVTFVIGIKALLLIVAVLYLAALLFRVRAQSAEAPATPAPG